MWNPLIKNTLPPCTKAVKPPKHIDSDIDTDYTKAARFIEERSGKTRNAARKTHCRSQYAPRGHKYFVPDYTQREPGGKGVLSMLRIFRITI